MEELNPALILVWEVRRSLEKGQSVREGVRGFLGRAGGGRPRKPRSRMFPRPASGLFAEQVRIWWHAQNSGAPGFDKSGLSPHRRHLLELLESGLRGHTISGPLLSLENELISACEREIQNHTAWLPLISLVPLLLLIFPALMILLLAPLAKMLQF